MERIISLSDQERRYIVEGVRNNIRLDGRHRLESRPFAVETSVVPAANGSARVILNGCEVIVGIKAEVVQPVLERPTEGVVDCQVECSSNVTAEVSASRGQIRDLNAELSAALKRLYSSEFNQNALNLKDLCIIPGKSCWAVHIDAIVLSMDGSILDCLSFAVRAALYSTLIPKVNVITSSSEHVSDFDVSSDPSDCHSLPILDIPIYVSLVRIGSSFVIDATLQEEVCMYCRVLVGINGSGTICSVTKYGAGGVSPSGLLDMLKTAKSVGKRIIFRINEELSSNQV